MKLESIVKMHNKNHVIEFERYASSYNSNAIIQKKVARELVGKLNFKPKRILDIGCGTGEIYKNISWEIEKFIGVDCSKAMCEIHPLSEKIEVICDDFESVNFKEKIRKLSPFDLVISSSSLQWSKELENTLKFYSTISEKVAFSVFTNKTFDTIYKMTKRENFLPSLKYLESLSKLFKNAQVSKKFYKLDFLDNISKLRYIKKSGTSGGSEPLNYKKTKYLIENYPHKYLEFEVVYIVN